MKDTSKTKKTVHSKYDWKRDKSFLSLLFSNIFSIFLIATSSNSICTILAIYWAQTLIMGIFAYIRVLKLKRRRKRKKEDVQKSEISVENENKRDANSYLSIYLFIQTVPLMFIVIGHASIDFWVVLIASVIFFLNHLYSFKYNYQDLISTGDKESITSEHITRSLLIMFVIPAIIFFNALFGSIIPLLAFKAYIDLMMHMAKHDKDRSRQYIENILKVAFIMLVFPFLFPVLYIVFGVAIVYFLEITGLHVYLGY
ncbi:MAG: hypothetical protein MNSN_10220 [Minisyncoccus archaeiphilus]|uniref:DUF6498-containing protein n=1 Tax=Minisyncoccus archaeiphilus TaxID=3238481 RepID=UPI002B0F03BA|nr:MAG: hypothetical protein MNSN_10220 [Candidatus Parcubacteria bacterium]